MRTLLIIFVGLLSLTNSLEAQEKPKKKPPKVTDTSITLRWKKPLKEAMSYDTKLVPLQAKELGHLLKQDLDHLMLTATAPIASFTESQPLWLGNVAMPFEKKMSTETFTILRPKKKTKDQFNVKIVTAFTRLEGQKLKPRTLIRATVDKFGVNKSFYVPQKEKNILSLFFQLPKNKVKKGDVWSIPFHFVSVPGAIHCKKSIQKSRVYLADIEKLKDGRVIASLEYRIIEHISGSLPAPPGHGHAHQLSLTMVFFAKARFDVTHGHWIRLRGRLRLTQSGEWASDYEQIFSLDLRDKMPAVLGKKP